MAEYYCVKTNNLLENFFSSFITAMDKLCHGFAMDLNYINLIKSFDCYIIKLHRLREIYVRKHTHTQRQQQQNQDRILNVSKGKSNNDKNRNNFNETKIVVNTRVINNVILLRFLILSEIFFVN